MSGVLKVLCLVMLAASLCARQRVSAQTGLAQIVEKADKMFANNEKEKGGSIYIQSKVLNAKDCLSIHLGEEIKDDPMEPPTSSGGDKPTQP